MGGKAPDVKIEGKVKNVSYERVHASQVKGSAEAPDWLGASVVEGAEQIIIETENKKGKAKLRLYFSDLEQQGKVGDRNFDVKIQGKKVLGKFDPVKEAGMKTVVMKEFPVELKDDGKLKIELKSVKGVTALAGVEVILE